MTLVRDYITPDSGRMVPMSKPSDVWALPDTYIGLEFEVENSYTLLDDFMNLPDPSAKYWVPKEDGSLRGHGTEFVLSTPVMGSALDKAISFMYKLLGEDVSEYASFRTSTHVHMDFSSDDDSIYALRDFITVLYVVEDILFEFAGQDRMWSGYCAPLSSVEDAVLELAGSDDPSLSHCIYTLVNLGRYCGVNFEALRKFNSLEFRHLPLVSEEKTRNWINILLSIRKYCANNASEISNKRIDLSNVPDIDAWLAAVFGKFYHAVTPISPACLRSVRSRLAALSTSGMAARNRQLGAAGWNARNTAAVRAVLGTIPDTATPELSLDDWVPEGVTPPPENDIVSDHIDAGEMSSQQSSPDADGDIHPF